MVARSRVDLVEHVAGPVNLIEADRNSGCVLLMLNSGAPDTAKSFPATRGLVRVADRSGIEEVSRAASARRWGSRPRAARRTVPGRARTGRTSAGPCARSSRKLGDITGIEC